MTMKVTEKAKMEVVMKVKVEVKVRMREAATKVNTAERNVSNM